MWTEIKFACGHTAEVQLYGSGESREWKARQMANDLCPDCKDKKAAEEAKEMGLPELEGSEKQVKWAENIRVEMLSDLSEHLEGYVAAIERQKGQSMTSSCVARSTLLFAAA